MGVAASLRIIRPGRNAWAGRGARLDGGSCIYNVSLTCSNGRNVDSGILQCRLRVSDLGWKRDSPALPGRRIGGIGPMDYKLVGRIDYKPCRVNSLHDLGGAKNLRRDEYGSGFVAQSDDQSGTALLRRYLITEWGFIATLSQHRLTAALPPRRLPERAYCDAVSIVLLRHYLNKPQGICASSNQNTTMRGNAGSSGLHHNVDRVQPMTLPP